MLRLPPQPGADSEEEKKQARSAVRQTFFVFIVTCAVFRARKQIGF